jgi:uncharacterized protein YegP (UPF0339 family)
VDDRMGVELYVDKGSDWRWRVRAPNGRIVADSSEGYSSKQHALEGLKLVTGTSRHIVVDK